MIYFKIIYANLVVQIKLYIDVEINDQFDLATRFIFFDYYNLLNTHSNFKTVKKSNFKKLKQRYRNKRTNFKIVDDKILFNRFVFFNFSFKKTRINENSIKIFDNDDDDDDNKKNLSMIKRNLLMIMKK